MKKHITRLALNVANAKKNLTLGDFRKNNEDLYCAKHYGEIINPFLKVEGNKSEKKRRRRGRKRRRRRRKSR